MKAAMGRKIFQISEESAQLDDVVVAPMSRQVEIKSIAASRQAFSILLSDPALRQTNLGELYAKRFAKECLDGMMEIARDSSLDPSVRHKAYFDVWTICYGRPGSIIKTPGEVAVPPTIDSDIDRAGEAAEALSRLEAYAAIPAEQWPEELKRATGVGLNGDAQKGGR